VYLSFAIRAILTDCLLTDCLRMGRRYRTVAGAQNGVVSVIDSNDNVGSSARVKLVVLNPTNRLGRKPNNDHYRSVSASHYLAKAGKNMRLLC